MTIEARPMGVACNIICTYCYQQPMRDAGNIHTRYDIDKMLEEIDKTGQPFNLFGGEILLVKKPDLERFFKHGLEKNIERAREIEKRTGDKPQIKGIGLQTNGTLIDDEHIELFKKYHVSPGVSIDGPDELNELRWAGSEDKTVEHTRRTITNIEKMRKAGIGVGIIITLHKKNAVGERLEKLMQFIRWLGDIGAKGGNIHVLEVDKTMPDQDKNVLTQEENIHAMLTLAKFFDDNPDLRWNPFREMGRLVTGDDKDTTCFWNYCDPGDTSAVYGIEGDGALSNCGRTNKEGIDWYKADRKSYARYISLYNTPPEMGGCKGCRFFVLCGGSCPGESIDSDFRNKTIHCQTQKALIGHYEAKMIRNGLVPITKSPQLPLIETIMLTRLAQGRRANVHGALKEIADNQKKVFQVPVLKEDE